jgi:hypothetical protein
LPKDPNRFWWMSLVFVVACPAGFHLFEKSMLPSSNGLVGTIVGFALGAFLAALFEDYIDHNVE